MSILVFFHPCHCVLRRWTSFCRENVLFVNDWKYIADNGEIGRNFSTQFLGHLCEAILYTYGLLWESPYGTGKYVCITKTRISSNGRTKEKSKSTKSSSKVANDILFPRHTDWFHKNFGSSTILYRLGWLFTGLLTVFIRFRCIFTGFSTVLVRKLMSDAFLLHFRRFYLKLDSPSDFSIVISPLPPPPCNITFFPDFTRFYVDNEKKNSMHTELLL